MEERLLMNERSQSRSGDVGPSARVQETGVTAKADCPPVPVHGATSLPPAYSVRVGFLQLGNDPFRRVENGAHNLFEFRAGKVDRGRRAAELHPPGIAYRKSLK